MGILDDLSSVTDRRASILDELGSGRPVDPNAQLQLDHDMLAQEGEFVKGLRRFGYSAAATVRAFGGQMLESFAPETSKRLMDDARQTLRDMPRGLDAKVANFSDVKDFGSFTDWAAYGLGEGLPSAGLAMAGSVLGRGAGSLFRRPLAGGVIGGTAAMLPMEGGETALDLHNDPVAMANSTPIERTLATAGRGGVNAALESAVPNALMLPRLFGKARTAPGFGNAARNIGAAAAEGAIGEYATEGAQELTGQAVQKYFNPATEWDLAKAHESGLRGALVGGGLGAGIGAVQSTVDNITDPLERGADYLKSKLPVTKGKFSVDNAVNAIRDAVDDPEAFGQNLQGMTFDAIDQLGKGVDVAKEYADKGLEGLGNIVENLNKAAMVHLGRRMKDPEAKAWLIDQMSAFGTMTAPEYQLFRKNFKNKTGTEFAEDVGLIAGLAGPRIKKTAADLADWVGKVGKGAFGPRAPAEGEKQSLDVPGYTDKDRQRFQSQLMATDDKLGKSLMQMDDDSRNQLTNMLMAATDDASYFEQPDPIRQSVAKDFRRITGKDLKSTFEAIRSLRRRTAPQNEQVAAAEPEMKLDDQIQLDEGEGAPAPVAGAETDEEDIAPPGQQAAEIFGEKADEGVAFTNDREVMNVERPDNSSPYNAQRFWEVISSDQEGHKDIPGTRMPVTLSATRLTETDANGEHVPFNVPPSRLAWAIKAKKGKLPITRQGVTDDKPFTVDINPMSLAAMVASPNNREAFMNHVAGYREGVPGSIQTLQRMTDAYDTLLANGIDVLAGEMYHPTQLKEMGMKPETSIHVDVNAEPMSKEQWHELLLKGGKDSLKVGDLAKPRKTNDELQQQFDVLKEISGGKTGFKGAAATLRDTGDDVRDALSKQAYARAKSENPRLAKRVADKTASKAQQNRFQKAQDKALASRMEEIQSSLFKRQSGSEVAELRRLYIGGDITSEQLSEIIAYYKGGEEMPEAYETYGLGPPVTMSPANHADALQDMKRDIDEGSEFSQAINEGTANEATDRNAEEFLAHKISPLARAHMMSPKRTRDRTITMSRLKRWYVSTLKALEAGDKDVKLPTVTTYTPNDPKTGTAKAATSYTPNTPGKLAKFMERVTSEMTREPVAPPDGYYDALWEALQPGEEKGVQRGLPPYKSKKLYERTTPEGDTEATTNPALFGITPKEGVDEKPAPVVAPDEKPPVREPKRVTDNYGNTIYPEIAAERAEIAKRKRSVVADRRREALKREEAREKGIALNASKRELEARAAKPRLEAEAAKEAAADAGRRTIKEKAIARKAEEAKAAEAKAIEDAKPVQIKEHSSDSYLPRTEHNAKTGDVTVRVAVNFESAGEVRTEHYATKHGKPVVDVDLKSMTPGRGADALAPVLAKTGGVLNVAGNGMFEMKKGGKTQAEVNQFMYDMLRQVHSAVPIKKIVSGGQTGADLAGAVAAKALGIPVVVTFPKGLKIQLSDRSPDKFESVEEVEATIDQYASELKGADKERAARDLTNKIRPYTPEAYTYDAMRGHEIPASVFGDGKIGAGELAQHIIKTAKNERVRNMATAMYDMLGETGATETKVALLSRDQMVDPKDNGSYSAGRDLVKIANDAEGRNAYVAMHELAHVLTTRAIDRAEALRSKEAIAKHMPEVTALMMLRTLVGERVWKTIRAEGARDVDAGTALTGSARIGKAAYGLNDVHEFVAEAFSNPRFQRLLATTQLSKAEKTMLDQLLGLGGPKDPELRTLWDAFVETVHKMLSSFMQGGNTTALAYTRSAIATLIANNATEDSMLRKPHEMDALFKELGANLFEDIERSTTKDPTLGPDPGRPPKTFTRQPKKPDQPVTPEAKPEELTSGIEPLKPVEKAPDEKPAVKARNFDEAPKAKPAKNLKRSVVKKTREAAKGMPQRVDAAVAKAVTGEKKPFDKAAWIAKKKAESAGGGGKPPGKPPKGPKSPKGPEGPTPSDSGDGSLTDAQRGFVERVEKMLGKGRVKFLFNQKLGKDIPATFQDRETWLKSHDEALKAIRDERRAIIKAAKAEGKKPDTKELDKLLAAEQALELGKGFHGVLRVAAGMEQRSGLAEHEAFHGAFKIFLGKHPEDRRVVTTAFTKGLVARRLREHFKDQPAVLEAIENDPEEAAAYGFQLWMADPGLLQPGDQVQSLYERVFKWLRDLVGILTTEQKAEMIFRDLRSGERAERGTSPIARVLDKERPWTERLMDHAKDITDVVSKGVDVLFTGTYNRLTETENPMLAKIARLGYEPTGEDGSDAGMIQRQRHESTRFFNRLGHTMEGLSEEQKLKLHDAMIFDKPSGDKAVDAARDKLNKLYKDLYKYQTDAKVDLANAGQDENYYPLMFDPEKVIKNKAKFLEMAKKYEKNWETIGKTPLEVWEGITSYIERGDDLVDAVGETGEPIAESARKRSLAFISKEDRREFMADDPIHTAVRYIKQATRQAEYVRAYGVRGAKFNKMLEEAKNTYGATPEQIALAKDYRDGLLGNKEAGMPRALKDLYGGLNVYQNYRLLPFNLFSSLVDPIGVGIRSNSVGAAWETFTYSMKNLFRDWQKTYTPDQWEKIATDWGIIEASGTTIGAHSMYDGITMRGATKTLNDALFKYNLLNGWIRSNTIMATKAAQMFFHRATDGTFKDEQAARYLEEVGLEKKDVIWDENLQRPLLTAEEFEGKGMSELQAKAAESKMRNATAKFVRQSLLQPSSPELANWASNPYFMPIAHLKQFVWSFDQTIVARVKHELKHDNFKPVMLAAAYVPGMIGAAWMRDMLSNMGDEPPYKKGWTAADYLDDGVKRSGLTGWGQFVGDAGDDLTRGGTGFESFSGPTVQQAQRGFRAFRSGDSNAMWNQMVKAAPLMPIYDQFLLSGSGAPQ